MVPSLGPHGLTPEVLAPVRLCCPCPSTLIDLIRATHERSPISRTFRLYEEPLLCGSA